MKSDCLEALFDDNILEDYSLPFDSLERGESFVYFKTLFPSFEDLKERYYVARCALIPILSAVTFHR